jgi:heme/copper-type cytochrome/quinol oxidase subunit 2
MRQTRENNNVLIRWFAITIIIIVAIALYQRTVYENEKGSAEHEKCIKALKIKK